MTVAKPAFASRASILSSLQNTSALEVADLKEKVKELHYRLEEQKLAQDKNNLDTEYKNGTRIIFTHPIS